MTGYLDDSGQVQFLQQEVRAGYNFLVFDVFVSQLSRP